MSPNLKAFLDTIAYAEIGPKLLAVSDNGYNVLVGSTPDKPLLFSDYSTHPMIHNDECNSDAAGRYQFLGRYWPAYKLQLRLTDFGPASQDCWCVQLLKECHALDAIEVGHIDTAISRCNRWASFPFTGNAYGQRIVPLQELLDAYHAFGGSFYAPPTP